MAETAARRARRSDNAKLMETNLSLLLEIRETDTEIDGVQRKLRTQCELLQKRGISLPTNFTELLAESNKQFTD